MEPRPEALDVVITHPLLPSFPHSEVAPGRRADDCVRAKQGHYAAQCSLAGWGFTGLGFETTGAWSASATSFVRRWARLLGMSSGVPALQCSASLAWAISALLAKAVGEQLLRGMGRVPLKLPSLAEAGAPPPPPPPQPSTAAPAEGERQLVYADPEHGIRVWARLEPGVSALGAC